MDIWALLGIEKTVDTKVIKRAYAKVLKNYHPEDDPEGFMRVREAYEKALGQAKAASKGVNFLVFDPISFEDTNKCNSENVSTPKDTIDSIHIRNNEEKFPTKSKEQFLERIELLYNDIFKRRDITCWQDLFTELTVDEYLYLDEHAWDFFNTNCSLPYDVWKLIDSEFSIFEDTRFRWTKLVQFDFGLSFDCFDQELDVDYSSYAKNRFFAFECFIRGDYKSTVQYAKEAEKIFDKDYMIYRLKGIALYFLRNYTEAIEAFSNALLLNSNDLDILLYRGYSWLKKSEYEKASMDFYTVLKIDMDNLDGLKGITMCMNAKKKYRSADKFYAHFNKNSPRGDLQIGILLDQNEKNKFLKKAKKIINTVKVVKHKIFSGETAGSYMFLFLFYILVLPPIIFFIFALPNAFNIVVILIIVYLLMKFFKYIRNN